MGDVVHGWHPCDGDVAPCGASIDAAPGVASDGFTDSIRFITCARCLAIARTSPGWLLRDGTQLERVL